MFKQVKPGFTTYQPRAKATQFQGNRHLIVGASYLDQELGQKEVNYNYFFFGNLIFFENVNFFLKKLILFSENMNFCNLSKNDRDNDNKEIPKAPRTEVTVTKTAKVTYYFFYLQFCMTMPLVKILYVRNSKVPFLFEYLSIIKNKSLSYKNIKCVVTIIFSESFIGLLAL